MASPSPAFLLAEKRFWLLILTTLVSVVIAFYTVPDAWALAFVTHAGFWFVLVTFGIFVVALWRTYRDAVQSIHWRTLDWATIVVVALGGIVLLVHETFGFKIVMDE